MGVLRGGPSAAYDVSLLSGQTVLRHLPRERYAVEDIFIDKEGAWHLRGREVPAERVFDQIDIVWNMLQGPFGEDGKLQHAFDVHGVRYTGSKALGCALAMHKTRAKEHVQSTCTQHLSSRAGAHQCHCRFCFGARLTYGSPCLAYAAHIPLSRNSCDEVAIREILSKLTPPLMVKPTNGTASLGTEVVSSVEELLYAVMFAFEHGADVIVEQYVRGREVSVVVVEGFRGVPYYVLPIVEVSPPMGRHYDYEVKQEGSARHFAPAQFDENVKTLIEDAARHAHRALGLRDYSQSDFIVGRDGVYYLETNTIPALSPGAPTHHALGAAGVPLPHFLEHIADRALARK